MKTWSYTIAVVLTLTVVGVGADTTGANLETLERDVERAKTAHDAAPTEANLAAVEAATETLAAAAALETGTRSGLSTKATVTESEPNDSSGTADSFVLNSDRGTGDIMPAADRDWWTSAGVAVGDLLFVLFDTGASTTGTDVEMSVFETDGTTLIEFDDDSGDGLGSAVAIAVPTAGSVFVELNEFGDNGTIEPYNLFIGAFAPGSTAAETEPNDTSGTAEALPGMVTTGDLGDATDDYFFFSASAGDRIGVVVNNDPDGDASNAAGSLTLFDTDGTSVLASEAPFTVTSQNAVAGSAVNTGVHYIAVTDGGGGTDSDYSLAVFVNDAAVPVELESLSVE